MLAIIETGVQKYGTTLRSIKNRGFRFQAWDIAEDAAPKRPDSAIHVYGCAFDPAPFVRTPVLMVDCSHNGCGGNKVPYLLKNGKIPYFIVLKNGKTEKTMSCDIVWTIGSTGY